MDKKTIKILETFIKNIKKDLNIERAILFGSRAIGNSKKDSDFDIIVVSKDFEGMSYFKRGAILYNYWPWLISVDFLCYTPREFNILKKRISIVKQAISEGIVLS